MKLITTIHDVDGNLLNFLDSTCLRLSSIFNETYVTISDRTCPKVIKKCQELFNNVKIIPKKGAADARRQVLKFALDDENRHRNEYIFYCDFDRVVTWIKTDFNSLQELARKEKFFSRIYDYIVIGRTLEAFNSHPDSWKETEKITNLIAELNLQIEDLDITAGASMFSPKYANIIALHSEHSHTDCEWPFIVRNHLGKIGSFKTSGLRFEKINEARKTTLHSEYYSRLRLSCHILSIFYE
ncbi:hypothetical protein MKN54_01010 [Streptococcus suis]|uniref:Uncharacterized protein n=1 Tax=Streptococcus suis TaxID=1307 RepID=A0A1X9I3A1_STRSU|nr:hypothetical protein [Streptococcus suis]AER15035.1 conserved hypothetical protein [Streptococcus suis SS12]ANJ64221.1 hypothetical protein [Streptococcus suis]MBS0800499.1 hypothetical protein [Streptococcus suis]MBS7965270.1 hypothetical protein [Streptococcus suis]MCH1652002.1 hypothetical protein [Streptococcus suis]